MQSSAGTKGIMMLLFVRTVTGFLQVPISPSRVLSATSRRSIHSLNSLWIQRSPNRRRFTEKEWPLHQASDASGETTSQNDNDIWSAYKNKNNIQDQVVSAISREGGIKVTACTVRNAVNDLMMQHTMTNVAIQAIGRTLTCSLLMANGMQAEQTVQISLACK